MKLFDIFYWCSLNPEEKIKMREAEIDLEKTKITAKAATNQTKILREKPGILRELLKYYHERKVLEVNNGLAPKKSRKKINGERITDNLTINIRDKKISFQKPPQKPKGNHSLGQTDMALH